MRSRGAAIVVMPGLEPNPAHGGPPCSPSFQRKNTARFATDAARPSSFPTRSAAVIPRRPRRGSTALSHAPSFIRPASPARTPGSDEAPHEGVRPALRADPGRIPRRVDPSIHRQARVRAGLADRRPSPIGGDHDTVARGPDELAPDRGDTIRGHHRASSPFASCSPSHPSGRFELPSLKVTFSPFHVFVPPANG